MSVERGGGGLFKGLFPPFTGAFRPRPSPLFLRWFGAAVAEIGSAKGGVSFPSTATGRQEGGGMLIPGASEKKRETEGGEAPICQLWVRSFVLRVRKEEECGRGSS